MMKKLLLTVCMIAASAFSALAQTEYSGFEIYGLGNKPRVKKITHSFELGIGNEIQAGYRIHYNFNKYLTWDMLGLQYANDCWGDDERDVYSDDEEDDAIFDAFSEIAITTGVRGFLPLGSSVKLFAALNLGYGHVWAEECDYYNDYYDEAYLGFLTDFSVGIRVKKISLSYGLQHITHRFSHIDHVARLAVTF